MPTKDPAKPQGEKKTRGKQLKTRPDQLLAAERRRKAFAMRKAGASYQAIADALGVSLSAAHAYVTELLQEIRECTEEDAKEVLHMELMRLDDMQLALQPAIKAGDTQAVEKAIKIMERRSKFLGLDAPKKIAPTTPEGKALSGGGLASLLAVASEMDAQD